MSCAFNADGDVTKTYNTPFGAMRKGILHIKDKAVTLTKLTLNGVLYDFQKQAREGLVVCGYDYQNITFFLPEEQNKRSIEPTLPEDATINDFLYFLATSNYANVKAWDNFIIALMDVVNSYSGFVDPSSISYTVTSVIDNTISLNGTVDFSAVNGAKDFFNALYLSLPQDDHPLSQWTEEDGVVSLNFSALGLTTNLYIGRK